MLTRSHFVQVWYLFQRRCLCPKGAGMECSLLQISQLLLLTLELGDECTSTPQCVVTGKCMAQLLGGHFLCEERAFSQGVLSVLSPPR